MAYFIIDSFFQIDKQEFNILSGLSQQRNEFDIQTGYSYIVSFLLRYYGLKDVEAIYDRIGYIKLMIFMNTLFLKSYFKHIAPDLYPQLVNPIYNHWDLFY